MKLPNAIVATIAAISLAIVFIGAGFLACTVPPCTHVLSSFFSDDVTSPFTRTQLTQVADATRDYSFGSHDKAALYKVIYDVDLEYRQDIIFRNGQLPFGFPDLDIVKDATDEKQTGSAFATASEMYCFSPNTVSHLDDCNAIARNGYVALAIAAIAALAALIACGVLGRKRLVGNALVAAGIVVVALLVVLGVLAAVNFDGFFAQFHQVFFSQGNWTFPYDSLLICALPTAFWIGMGAIWLVVSLLVSILSVLIGFKVRK